MLPLVNLTRAGLPTLTTAAPRTVSPLVTLAMNTPSLPHLREVPLLGMQPLDAYPRVRIAVSIPFLRCELYKRLITIVSPRRTDLWVVQERSRAGTIG